MLTKKNPKMNETFFRILKDQNGQFHKITALRHKIGLLEKLWLIPYK